MCTKYICNCGVASTVTVDCFEADVLLGCRHATSDLLPRAEPCMACVSQNRMRFMQLVRRSYCVAGCFAEPTSCRQPCSTFSRQLRMVLKMHTFTQAALRRPTRWAAAAPSMANRRLSAPLSRLLPQSWSSCEHPTLGSRRCTSCRSTQTRSSWSAPYFPPSFGLHYPGSSWASVPEPSARRLLSGHRPSSGTHDCFPHIGP